ncbi:MAG: hypothetical protein DDT37_01406 [Firmicutes bacterium]|nr:hypothetical protein [candidate division NPL-UPA2 bacterium]
MGMKPEYFPKGYGPTRPRRVQPALAPQAEASPNTPLYQLGLPFVPTAPSDPLLSPTSRSSPPVIAIDREAARLGVIWSEILGAPRARRPWTKQ